MIPNDIYKLGPYLNRRPDGEGDRGDLLELSFRYEIPFITHSEEYAKIARSQHGMAHIFVNQLFMLEKIAQDYGPRFEGKIPVILDSDLVELHEFDSRLLHSLTPDQLRELALTDMSKGGPQKFVIKGGKIKWLA